MDPDERLIERFRYQLDEALAPPCTACAGRGTVTVTVETAGWWCGAARQVGEEVPICRLDLAHYVSADRDIEYWPAWMLADLDHPRATIGCVRFGVYGLVEPPGSPGVPTA